MAEVLIQNNVNDEKMYLVQKLLNEGKAKFKVARAVGYQGVDGLDRYARSVGYAWNVITKNYELKDSVKIVENPSDRIVKILSMVEKEIDLNDIAKYFKMKGSNELAEYMKSKGYIWNIEKGNYTKKSFVINKNEETESKEDLQNVSAEYNDKDVNDIDIIKLLEANKGKLIQLLSYKQQNTIPKYVLKGFMVTKSFYISTEVDRLVKDFSNRKGITQKDILHTALLEYFQKYGYKEEVEVLFT